MITREGSGGRILVKGVGQVESCRILIAGSNRFECQLLAESLGRSQSGFVVLGCATTRAEALAASRNHSPDVVLINQSLEDGPLSGLMLLQELPSVSPASRAVILAENSERDLVLEAFRKGAKGVFSRDNPTKLLCKCLRRVHEGQIWANSRELQFILEGLAQSAPRRLLNAKGAALLTKREEEVARLVAEGFKNSEISSELGLSEHTVKNYLFRIFEKLGISSRAELILYTLARREPNGEVGQMG